MAQEVRIKEESRSRWELLSDFFREASVLILVFGLLDKFVHSADNGSVAKPFEWDIGSLSYGAIIMASAIASFVIGLGFERKRDGG